ncbi:hypothetical protein LIER_41547 [Lithospermum erythrorhizon]|uniref:MULE transposase domain-containing protein n=1 Tax=Lithospermum erythrorhizon TaxID=34254 RepID=A0AAV3REM6_LITER
MDLGGSKPLLSSAFIEQLKEDVVLEEDVELEEHRLPEDVLLVDLLLQHTYGIKNRKGKQLVLRKFDANNVAGTSEPSSAALRKKKYKGPYARHGVQFRERWLAGNVSNASDDSNHASDVNVNDSDFDSDNRTSDSDKEDGTIKFTDEMRKKNKYVHFNEKRIKNSKLFPFLIFSSSSQFKEVMTWLLPDISFKVLKVAVDKKFGLMITDHQTRRVMEKALKTIEGDHNDQFNLIFDYIEELKKSHPGSIVFAEWDVSLEDVALDPNNGWWSVCWVVVEKENKETWKWFIQALSEVIGIVDEEDYVIISDKQKGLQSALGEILPRVEHRNCVELIYRNFKRHRESQLLRNKFWACARATIRANHLAEIFDFKKLDPAGYDWIEKNAGNPKTGVKLSFH